MTRGIVVGLVLALLQTTCSVGAMRWAWSRSCFYWVWGGGMLFRLVVFGVTAYVVYVHTKLPLVATLLSMVCFTTLFMILESSIFLKPRQNKKNGFSASA